jgi:hypothetical protein
VMVINCHICTIFNPFSSFSFLHREVPLTRWRVFTNPTVIDIVSCVFDFICDVLFGMLTLIILRV